MNPGNESQTLQRAAFQIKRLGGIVLPITTPFQKDGTVDVRALRSNLHDWNESGIRGYVVLGSTGERVHLDEREYLEVVEATRAEVPKGPDGLVVIVGAGQQSTRGTINEVRKAAKAGADAALVITPYFYRPAITQEALVSHYLAVADESPVPVILYSMPPFTGIKIEPQTVARLRQHENIIGIKDSSSDVTKLKETAELVRGGSLVNMSFPTGDFAVLTGNGTVLHEALRAGAVGAILAVGCVVPEVCMEIFRATRDSNDDRAATLQEKLTPLATAVTTKYGIGGLKAAMDMSGYRGGAVRAPLLAPDDRAREEIAHLLNEVQAAFNEQPLVTGA